MDYYYCVCNTCISSVKSLQTIDTPLDLFFLNRTKHKLCLDTDSVNDGRSKSAKGQCANEPGRVVRLYDRLVSSPVLVLHSSYYNGSLLLPCSTIQWLFAALPSLLRIVN